MCMLRAIVACGAIWQDIIYFTVISEGYRGEKAVGWFAAMGGSDVWRIKEIGNSLNMKFFTYKKLQQIKNIITISTRIRLHGSCQHLKITSKRVFIITLP